MSEKTITRTTITTKVNAVELTEELEVKKVELMIPGKLTKDLAETKAKKQNRNIVKVVSVEYLEELRFMTESDWLKYSKPCDSRYVKKEDR